MVRVYFWGVRVWGLGFFFQVYGSGFVGFRIWGFRGVGVSGFRVRCITSLCSW